MVTVQVQGQDDWMLVKFPLARLWTTMQSGTKEENETNLQSSWRITDWFLIHIELIVGKQWVVPNGQDGHI